MPLRRTLIILSILMLALPLAVYSSRATQDQQAATSSERNVQVHTVARGDVQVTISAIGEIDPDSQASLSVTRGGRVLEIPVEEGQAVEAGTVLVRLDDTTEQLAYQQAELALQTAQLTLDDLLDGPDEGDIRIAEANIQSAQGSYSAIAGSVTDEQIQAAQLRYEQAQQVYEDANRARRVANGSNEEATAGLDAQIGEASFNMEIARLQLEQLRNSNGPDLNAAGARIAQMQAELARVQAGPTEQQIRNAEVGIERAQTDLDQAAQNLSRRQLVAPSAGLVSTINVEVGALVAPGSPIVELVDIDPLRVTVDVDEIDIRRIREGMPATISIDALSNVDLPAVLERIALVGETADGITSYPVDVALVNHNPAVRVGMTAEAEVVVESRDNVVVVPNQFIRLDRRANRAFVNVVQPDGLLQEVEIQLGLQGDSQSEVVAGLDAGDVIAIDLSAQGVSFFG